jgi:hypothetical protein
MKRFVTIAILILIVASFIHADDAEARRSRSRRFGNTSAVSSYGLGLGIPYGVLGCNVDREIAPNLHLTGGIGTTILAGVGYNAGLKYYLVPPGQSFRPRVSAYYGINSMVYVEGPWGYEESESYTGLTLGVGAQWMWGKTQSNGIDFDIMYIATSSWDLDELERYGIEVEEPGNIKISIGWRHAY